MDRAVTLLDSGPDEIQWFAEVEVEDDYGTPVRQPSPTPTAQFTCQVQRVSSEEAAELGQSRDKVYSFQTSRAISGASSGLTVNGRPCEVIGEPLAQGRSPRTRSTKVRFRYVGPDELEVPPDEP